MTKLICIDSGHGSIDKGARYNYADEANINMGIALFLEYELYDKGFQPILTRVDDMKEEMSLEARVEISNKYQADLFISIHCDAFEDSSVRGKRIHHFPGSVQGRVLAQSIVNQCKLYDNKIRTKVMESNFQVIRDTHAPAVLCECGFISNYDECEKLKKAEIQKEIAILICRGVVTYYGA